MAAAIVFVIVLYFCAMLESVYISIDLAIQNLINYPIHVATLYSTRVKSKPPNQTVKQLILEILEVMKVKMHIRSYIENNYYFCLYF